MVAGLYENPRDLSLNLWIDRRRVPRFQDGQILGGIRDFHRGSNPYLNRHSRSSSARRIVGRALLAPVNKSACRQCQQQSGPPLRQRWASHPVIDRFEWAHACLPDLKSYYSVRQEQNGKGPSPIGRQGKLLVTWKFLAAA